MGDLEGEGLSSGEGWAYEAGLRPLLGGGRAKEPWSDYIAW
jgi:hypothetical protein